MPEVPDINAIKADLSRLDPSLVKKIADLKRKEDQTSKQATPPNPNFTTIDSLIGPPREKPPVSPYDSEEPGLKEPEPVQGETRKDISVDGAPDVPIKTYTVDIDPDNVDKTVKGKDVPPKSLVKRAYEEGQQNHGTLDEVSYVAKMRDHNAQKKVVQQRNRFLGERWAEDRSRFEGENDAYSIGASTGKLESDDQWIRALKAKGETEETIAKIWHEKEEEARKLRLEKARIKEEPPK